MNEDTGRIIAQEELITSPGAVFYLGGKSAENAIVEDISISLAPSETTDGMDITITCLNGAGIRIPVAHCLEVWISESAAGEGLTADSYSGDVTAATGAILTALTAKKHFSVITATSGIAVLTAVDDANPEDQYIAARNPFTGKVHVSAVSGANWEGV